MIMTAATETIIAQFKMLLEILKKYWGYDTFRPLQEDIINAVLNRQDTLALMPTGGGKSLCFQVPALAMEGVCIVVTPLVSLMKDQVEQLTKRGIKAAAVYSGMHRSEIDYTIDDFIYREGKFLYVSPERLQTEIMRVRVKMMKVCLIAIDEAHCVSQWGYDFRPFYLRIPEFRKLIPNNPPLIALTATATKDVKTDIQAKLEMKNVVVFQQSFARPNISYSAFEVENREGKMFEILSRVGGSAVVYVRSRKRTKEISDWLNQNRISSAFYHAGLSNQERFKKQDAWIRNQVQVMVATNAFGMGIDKPDVRVVVHIDLPETLEAYYQEAGRAGRDGKKAYAVALTQKSDAEDLQRNIERKYPPLETLKRVYQCLANQFRLAVGSESFSSFDFDFEQFITNFGLSANETHNALKKLEDEGLIQLSDAFYSPSKLYFTVNNNELYSFQLKNANYDKFTKLILRMYGGEIFTNYTTISESAIGRNMYAEQHEVEKMLRYLHEVGIAIYQPQKNTPQLTFTMPRQDVEYLPINHAANEQRKKLDLSRAESVIVYVGERRRCRMQLLQEYFDEFTNKTCGVCDNCLNRKKIGLSDELVADYRRKIFELIPANINELADYQYFKNKNALTEILRTMLENGEVWYSEMGVIARKGKF
jgi:ATP-dependent DNA helicase RecQ